MKKLLTTLTLVLGLSPVLFAQTKSKTEFSITLGYNSASVTTSDNINADYRGGFNAGVGAEQYFSDSWGLKVKALYDQKGWANGFLSTGTSSINTDYSLGYITVPVMADWHFGRTKNWYLNFGPYISFLMSAKAVANSQDVKSYFSSTDGGLDVGIGVKFPVGENTKFFIEANGQGGVTNISSSNSGSSIRNSVSALNIGLSF